MDQTFLSFSVLSPDVLGTKVEDLIKFKDAKQELANLEIITTIDTSEKNIEFHKSLAALKNSLNAVALEKRLEKEYRKKFKKAETEDAKTKLTTQLNADRAKIQKLLTLETQPAFEPYHWKAN